MVPPGTAALAAAVALAASSPVSSVSVMPFAMWPPLLGSNAGGAFAGSGVDWAGAVAVGSVVLVCALAVPPSTAAPKAPPTRVEPSRLTLRIALRVLFMVFSFGVSPPNGSGYMDIFGLAHQRRLGVAWESPPTSDARFDARFRPPRTGHVWGSGTLRVDRAEGLERDRAVASVPDRRLPS